MKTKIFALLFTFSVGVETLYCQTVISVGANLSWNLSNGTLTISGNGAMNDFHYSTYQPYTTKESPWYSARASIKRVVINSGVTSIGNNAFLDCSGLTSVTIPNSVTSIGSSAFNGCSSLTSVTIPNSVTSIGSSAFQGCSGLTSMTIGNSVTSIGSSAFKDCSGLTGELVIPNSVTSIGSSAFNGCSSLTSVTIPNSVTSIGNNAFQGCSGLTSVTIPNSVTSIGDGAFYKCSGLTSVTIPNSVTSIGSDAFSGCNSLTSVTIPNSVTSIGNRAFRWCSGLTSVTIGNSVTSIGDNAFQGCTGLTSVTIPNSVTSIGQLAFSDCSSLTSITIPNSVTSIDRYAFSGCSGLTSVTIPNSVTSIGEWAFAYCSSLTSVTIGNSVTSIGEYAFAYCSSLTSITIPNSVTSIGQCAFHKCSGLTSVTCLAPTPPTCLGSSCFSGVNCSNIPLYVPMESVSLYQAANIWKEFNVIGIMFADEVETAVFSATPTDNYGVILEWQAVENAVLYNIDIIQGNDTIRKLQFDSNGKLLNSPSNAPSRYPNIHHASAAILSGNGWRYEVNDLDPGTNYTYSITVKAENGSVLYTQSISFTTKEKTFIIKFVNWNGEELLVLPEVVKGTTPSYTGETPVRPNTAEYTYTFVGWTPAIVAVTSDTTYTATYTATKNSYTITWQNEDGSLIDQTTVEYGVVPTHAEPTKQATAEYTYTFAGWTPAVVAVTGDATYKATFTATKNSYTITWQNEDGSLIDQTTVEYGKTPTHANPTKAATAEFTYTFAGWTPNVVAVTGDATYTATFNSSVNKYSISATAINGSVNGAGTYPYGTQVKLTAVPNYGYHFTQWSDGNTNNPRTFVLTRDTTFTAEFAIDKSGTCGKNNLLQWTFADDGTLTISGSGELTENYTFGLEAPTQMQQLVVGNEVTAIGERAFYGKTTLQKLIIGSNVTSIGKYAFASINNRQLTSLVMPAELLTIGDYAFSGNTYLESIDFNAKLQSIGAYAFKDCYRVSEMTCLATVTPNVGSGGISSISSNAELYVLSSALQKYKVDPNWSRFFVKELGASETTSTGEVVVEPGDNTATFTWPTESNAGSYTLQITKDGEVFCTLIFNRNGQLTGIAFAPSRDGTSHCPAATMTARGMQFTVTGLDMGTLYRFDLAVRDNNSRVLAEYAGSFLTNGLEDIDDIAADTKATKIYHDGQIFILRGEKVFTVTGQEVK